MLLFAVLPQGYYRAIAADERDFGVVRLMDTVKRKRERRRWMDVILSLGGRWVLLWWPTVAE